MFDMGFISSEMQASKPYFKMFSPSYPHLLKGKPQLWLKLAFRIKRGIKIVREAEAGTPYEKILGEYLAGETIRYVVSPVKGRVAKLHRVAAHAPKKDFFRKNGLGGRYWYNAPTRQPVTIIFHDANRVGPHVDVHIGRLSVVYRVKPDVYSQLKYNSSGKLTENSKALLLDFVKDEIARGAYVPQNLDHSRSNAKASWYNGDRSSTHYGAGFTRQIIAETQVEIYKAHDNGPIEFYMPLLNQHRSMYLYRIFNGDDKKAPILIWGNKSPTTPEFHDRLHLKLIHPEDLETHTEVIDEDATTAKYDGSSCYLVIGPKGTTIWSPRHSVVTGERIEYTQKISELAHVTNPETVVAMGEVLFRTKTYFPWQKSTYVPQATGGGILNSNALRPKNVVPEIRLYRVDSVGRKRVVDLNFWENRQYQESVASLKPDTLKVVELMDAPTAAKRGFEGVVTVPYEASVNAAYKTKWWSDAADWRVDSVEFYHGPNGGVAGVIRATSLESGKSFKLGPSQVGDQTLTREMIAHPNLYEGTVLKVQSRHGHEGRASKVIGFHDDKGLAPR